jgi:hypothetical protein
MSMGHMKSITETQDYFERLLEDIELPVEDRQQIFFDLNNHFEEWIDKVFATIRSKEEQYCFTLDLYSILKRTSWAREYCTNILEDYLQVFQFSEAERTFFDDFYHAAQRDNVQEAVKAYQQLWAEGYPIRYDFLTWFYNGFYLEEQYEGFKVSAGETMVLDHPTVVKGDIEVDKGGSLLIYGASIRMEGSIFVHGGRFQIDHGEIQIQDCSAPYWLWLEDTSVVTIIDTFIDCQYHCGVLHQTSGRLLVEDSVFQKTQGKRALSFSGRAVKIVHSRFREAKDGMIALEGLSSARLELCDFHNSYGEYGGAIYSDTIHNVRISQCTFRGCHAKYLGAAVYFKTQKLGQQIMDCKCEDGIPRDNPFFNAL